MTRLARIVVLALDYSAARELQVLLSDPDHDILVARSVDEAAGLWLGPRPDLLVLEVPSPGLALRRLAARLRGRAQFWRQPALVVLPSGSPTAWTEREMLAVPAVRPLSAGLRDDARVLVRLGRALSSDGAAAGALAAPLPDSGVARASDLVLRLLARRDTADPGHPQRVCRLALLLALRTGLPAGARGPLERAALWHDVGKLAIHPGILHREGPLSESERAVVRLHPAQGMNLVRQMLGDDLAALSILHHHERVDGSGYLGLAAGAPSASARILALAEAWDGMASRQVFRPALPSDEALRRLQAERRRFDLAVFGALEEIHAEGQTAAGAI